MRSTRYSQLTKLFKNQWKNKCILLIICIISISLTLYFTYQIQALVDVIVTEKAPAEIMSLFCKIIVLVIAAFIISIIQINQWHIFRYKMMNQMRTMMIQKLLNKEAIFFDGKTTGDMVSAIISDGSLIAELAGINILMLFLNLYQIMIIMFVLLHENIILGVAECIVGFLYFISINLINKRMRASYTEFSKETANLNQTIVEDINAVYEIKNLNEKRYFINKFNEQMWGKYFPSAKKVINIDVLSYSVNQFINLIFPMLILVVGAVFTYYGHLSIGVVILFFTYTQKLVEPLNNLSDFYRGTQVAVGAADRVYEYLFEEREERKNEEQKEQVEVSLTIDIDQFAWGERESILKNIHEKYVAADRVFIQGESGAGKSTLLKLICGFYDMPFGNIQINNCNVREMSEEQIFDWVKIQFQEPIILEGSIRENIELGQNFSEEEIMKALKIASLDTFVKEMGLDYQISESGKNLSGGQKQRLALARIVLRKPQILILDEATSGLDEENERTVITNLKKYVEEQGCILIVTSHRESLKSICNKILVL